LSYDGGPYPLLAGAASSWGDNRHGQWVRCLGLPTGQELFDGFEPEADLPAYADGGQLPGAGQAKDGRLGDSQDPGNVVGAQQCVHDGTYAGPQD